MRLASSSFRRALVRAGLAGLAGLVAVAAAGCHSTLGPSDATGTYVLRSIGGDALPAASYVDAFGESAITYADTIRLRADGSGTRATRTSAVNLPVGAQYAVFDLHATVRGRSVQLFYDCPANAQCIGIPPGHLTTNGLTLDATDGFRGPMVYQRTSTSP